MKTLEIIHLRMAGDSPQALVDVIRKSVGSQPDLADLRIYRHSSWRPISLSTFTAR